MLVWMAALDIGLTMYEDFELETLKPGQEVAKFPYHKCKAVKVHIVSFIPIFLAT